MEFGKIKYSPKLERWYNQIQECKHRFHIKQILKSIKRTQNIIHLLFTEIFLYYGAQKFLY